MKNIIPIIVAVFISTSFLSAQNSETRSLEHFDEISVSSSIDAEMRKGSTNEVKVSVRNIDIDKIITKVDGDRLIVSTKKVKYNNWKKGTKIKVVITYTEDPTYIAVSASSDLVAHDVIKTDKLELRVSASSDLELEIDVNTLSAKTSASSDIEIGGRADQAKVTVNSSSDFMGQHLKTKDAVLSASASSDIEISVSESIKAKAKSSSDIIYYGSPSEKDISKSSSGDVHRMKG